MKKIRERKFFENFSLLRTPKMPVRRKVPKVLVLFFAKLSNDRHKNLLPIRNVLRLLPGSAVRCPNPIGPKPPKFLECPDVEYKSSNNKVRLHLDQRPNILILLRTMDRKRPLGNAIFRFDNSSEFGQKR